MGFEFGREPDIQVGCPDMSVRVDCADMKHALEVIRHPPSRIAGGSRHLMAENIPHPPDELAADSRHPPGRAAGDSRHPPDPIAFDLGSLVPAYRGAPAQRLLGAKQHIW